jgi:hypothetical protein
MWSTREVVSRPGRGREEGGRSRELGSERGREAEAEVYPESAR